VKLYLHTPDESTELGSDYKAAFTDAIELFIVTAYLTEWDETLKLNTGCKNFRIIIGKDFGITRKFACKKVMKWLPAQRKSQFMVADLISGFHPKAMFWKSKNNKYFSVVGSSNLTKAAFETNYEANTYTELSKAEYEKAKIWVKEIENLSVVVTDSWLDKYQEGESKPKKRGKIKKTNIKTQEQVAEFSLPNPKGAKELVKKRRKRLSTHQKYKSKLLGQFKACANGKITSTVFYESLPDYWSTPIGNRLQGAGWERKGKSTNFRQLSESFIKIYNSSDLDRDDLVTDEIDKLAKFKNTGRTAFLSEILCLTFPDKYPVLNKPVHAYISDIDLKAPRGASEGSKYIDLAKKLRFSLLQNPKHPAKNLAELDTVIWLEYRE
jgi:HKD family nuclease